MKRLFISLILVLFTTAATDNDMLYTNSQGFAIVDFNLYDQNQDGYMTFDEYYKTYVKYYGPIEGKTLKVEFISMDTNRDGFVTREESQSDDSVYYQDNDDLFEIIDY